MNDRSDASMADMLEALGDHLQAVGLKPKEQHRSRDEVAVGLAELLGRQPHDEVVALFIFIEHWRQCWPFAPAPMVELGGLDDHSLIEAFRNDVHYPSKDVSAVAIRDGVFDWVFVGGDGTGFTYAISPASAGGGVPKVLMTGEGSYGIHIADPDGSTVDLATTPEDLPTLHQWVAAMLHGFDAGYFVARLAPRSDGTGLMVDRKDLTDDTSSLNLYPWPPPVSVPNEGRPLAPRFVLARSSVVSADLSPDGSLILTGHADGEICLWDAENGHELFAFPTDLGRYCRPRWSPDGSKFVASGSVDHIGRAIVWNSESIKVELEIDAGFVSWSPSGKHLFALKTPSWNQPPHLRDPAQILVWIVEPWQQIVDQLWEGQTQFHSWSPDGSFMLLSCERRRIGIREWRIVQSSTGAQVVWTPRRPNDKPRRESEVPPTWSPDSTCLAIAYETNVGIFSVDGPTSQVHKSSLSGEIWGLEWSPDGSRLAVGQGTGVEIWRLGQEIDRQSTTTLGSDGEPFTTGFQPIHPRRALSWSPDGTRIVSNAAPDLAVRINDVESGEVVHVLQALPGWFRGAPSWSPTGRFLVSAVARTTRIWESSSGVIRHSFRETPNHVIWGLDDTFVLTVTPELRRRDLT